MKNTMNLYNHMKTVSYTHLDPKAVMKDVLANCKKVEDDCEIYL